jgi:hypothetical protein
MGIDQHGENKRLARVVESRAGVGTTDIVTGWQSVLVEILSRMKSFLRPGGAVTFKHLNASETAFFERFINEVRIPPSAAALYIPPSVREQMVGENQVTGEDIGPPDAGVVVASHLDDFDVIVNILFAFHPFTPAIDVYDRGRLLAGYQFESIDACISELSMVLDRHLGMPPPTS